jgi:HEAT repeat protein
LVDPQIIDEFHNNEPSPQIEKGDSRPSKLVDLQNFESIRRRQALNTMMLRRICGESVGGVQTFSQEDRDILIQMALERDPNGNVAIRKHAIDALRQYKDLKVAESLLDISSSDVEDEIVRSHALMSLAETSPKIAKSILSYHISDKSPLIRQTVANIIGKIGDESAIDTLDRLLQDERDAAVLHQASTAIQSAEKRLGIAIDMKIKRRLKPPKKYHESRSPKSETKPARKGS